MMAAMVSSPADPARQAGDYDAVLVDDDALVQHMWRVAAEQGGRRLLVATTWQDLQAQLPGLRRSIPIYLDYSLVVPRGWGDLPQQLVGAGFANVYLQTGYDVEAIPPLVRSWVKGVLGKEPPWP